MQHQIVTIRKHVRQDSYSQQLSPVGHSLRLLVLLLVYDGLPVASGRRLRLWLGLVLIRLHLLVLRAVLRVVAGGVLLVVVL